MSLDKFNTTPSPLQVVEKVNDVIDALDAGSFDGYWEAGESVQVGDIRYVEGRDNVGYVLECIQAGTTGNSAPAVSDEDIEPSAPEASNLNEFEGVLGIEKGGTNATTANEACANIGALPLSGGQMTGNLAPYALYAKRLDDSVTFGIGTTWNDAPSLSLYGPNVTSGIINGFQLRAGANACALTGKPDGTLTWAGNKVATSNSSGHLVLPDGSEFWIA